MQTHGAEQHTEPVVGADEVVVDGDRLAELDNGGTEVAFLLEKPGGGEVRLGQNLRFRDVFHVPVLRFVQ